MTADFAAECGRASGGQIRMATKRGARDFHGSLCEYFRNSDVNTYTWGAPFKLPSISPRRLPV